MCGVTAAVAGVGLGLMGAGSIMQYSNARASAKMQANTAMIGAGLQARQYEMQSAILAAQARGYGQQAAMYDAQAATVARTGRIQRAFSNYRAVQAETEGEQKSRVAAEERRQFVGTALTTFAANGVLLEARQGAAVAMWEQDEADDLGFELRQIRTNTENEVFGHVWNGYTQEIQGLYDAQALSLQALGSRMAAKNAMGESYLAKVGGQNALLQGRVAQNQAKADRNAALWNMIGGLGSMATSASSVNWSTPKAGSPLVK